MKKGITILSLLLLVAACDKPSGEGGTSAIEGKILVLEGFYNVFTQSFDTTALYYSENEDVYIIYGSDSSSIYNDSFETSWDGSYRFDYLRKGNYVLYAYSDCDSCPSGKEPVFWEVTIGKNNQVYQISDQVIRK